ncbi:hypothetical protein HY090_00555 [Candidatus Kaiserbacteria bacterium]|nr:hypothetical protein [Candidatus Kaiserbacteria bacterium]
MQSVFVGLSGGVDSAVSAYLLKKQGYKVVGTFIKGWEPDFLPCTGAEDRLSAMRVAAHLEIPFVLYDLEKEYKQEVVDYFISEYKTGRTPNPDVMCNRAIKFGAFWQKAKADGADLIATGHYAVSSLEAQSWKLKASCDSEKDQTYFLWTLTQEHGFSASVNERHYVVLKDMKKNELIVSTGPLGEHLEKTFTLLNQNWISSSAPDGGLLARYRYRQQLLPAKVEGKKVMFDAPQLIAAGQSVVFYDSRGEACLGGGIIA